MDNIFQRSGTLSTMTVVLACGKFNPDDHRELNVPAVELLAFSVECLSQQWFLPKSFMVDTSEIHVRAFPTHW